MHPPFKRGYYTEAASSRILCNTVYNSLRLKNRVQRVSKKYLTGKGKPKVGGQVTLRLPDGLRLATVLKVGGSIIDVDLNHPMAGLTLIFDIEVLDVRAAEPEEIAHGHVHGTGGHHH